MHELVKDGTPTGKRRDFAGTPPPDFTGHPTKGGWAWLPVRVVTPALVADEVLNGETRRVEAGEVVVTRQKRAKTVAELAAEARAARDLYVEADALAARVAALEGR